MHVLGVDLQLELLRKRYCVKTRTQSSIGCKLYSPFSQVKTNKSGETTLLYSDETK